MKICVQREDFDCGAEIEALAHGNPAVGAVAAFVGLVRDVNDGAAVGRMTLEHYPGMTEKAIGAIVEQAHGRWEMIDCTVIAHCADAVHGNSDAISKANGWRNAFIGSGI